MTNLDERLLLWINQGWASPWADTLFVWLSATLAFSLPLAFVLLVFAYARLGLDGVRAWMLLVLLVILGDLLGNALKHLLQVPRPCHALREAVRVPAGCASPLAGTPSNHALNFFVLAVFTWRMHRLRWLTAVMFAIAVAVCVSRMYLAKHFLSQLIIGGTLGAAVGYAGFAVGCWLFAFMRELAARTAPAQKPVAQA
jgi:undecaprenyl-diphosphatase